MRLLAAVLALLFVAQPVPLLAQVLWGADSCCKDGQACCCRKSHKASSGPGLAADQACSTCHVQVRAVQQTASTTPQTAHTELAAGIQAAAVSEGHARHVGTEPFLYQRPPPHFV